MPSFSSGMFVTFKLSLIPEFIGDLKELLMLPLVYGIAFSLKKFSDTREHCFWDDLYSSNCVSTDITVPAFILVMSFILLYILKYLYIYIMLIRVNT